MRPIDETRAVRRRGATLVYAAIALTATTALASLAVDYGRAQLVKTQLQTAADAAARHAVGGLADDTWLSRAQQAAAENGADGTAVILQAGDVQTGAWDSQSGVFTPGATPANALRVTARRSASRGDAVPTVFGALFGRAGVDVHAEAIATVSGGGWTDPIALYKFDEGSGTIIFDQSGYGAAENLVISEPGKVQWLGGSGGIRITSNTTITTDGPSNKIRAALAASNQFTVEVQFNPTSAPNGPSSVMSIGDGISSRGVVGGLQNKGMTGNLRTTNTPPTGEPGLSPTSGNHVPGSFNGGYGMVMTFNGTQFRLGGRRHADNAMRYRSRSDGGSINWAEEVQLALGNELSGNRSYLGTITRVAIYNYALDAGQVDQLLKTGTFTVTSSQGGAPTVALVH